MTYELSKEQQSIVLQQHFFLFLLYNFHSLKFEIDFTVCAGPEITDELVKVLRKRLDETTLDIITVMLVRNCKLTPADVEVRPFI